MSKDEKVWYESVRIRYGNKRQINGLYNNDIIHYGQHKQ